MANGMVLYIGLEHLERVEGRSREMVLFMGSCSLVVVLFVVLLFS